MLITIHTPLQLSLWCRDNCNGAWIVINNILDSLYDTYIHKLRAISKIIVPWINRDIKSMLKTKKRNTCIPKLCAISKIIVPWMNCEIKAMLKTNKQKWHVYKRNMSGVNLRLYREYCKLHKYRNIVSYTKNVFVTHASDFRYLFFSGG